jgi:large repetitive protein
VALTGTNFIPGATVAVAGNGVTAGNVIVVSSTSITATFAIAPTAATGLRNVSVTTAGGTSTNIAAFTVNNPPVATLTTIAPNTGTRGNSVSVTLTGTNFTTNGTSVSVSGAGVSVSGTSVVSATQITTTFTIAATAGLGGHTVTVTTPVGNTGILPTAAHTFTVSNPPSPTLTSITPNAGPRGFDTDVKLTGTNFTFTGGTVLVDGSATNATVTPSALLVDSAVNAETTLAIAATATIGPHTIAVRTPGGTSNTVTFIVQGPTLASITPASGARGTSANVTLTGTLLTGATAINAGPGINVSTITSSVGGTQITATFTITGGASVGARNVVVTTPNGNTTGTVTFTVQ